YLLRTCPISALGARDGSSRSQAPLQGIRFRGNRDTNVVQVFDVSAGVNTISVTRFDIRNKQSYRSTLPGGEGFESLAVHEDSSVEDCSERHTGREIIGTSAKSDVRRVLPHAGHPKESPQPHRTPVASRDQCPNLGHLIWESSQVNKTKR